MHDGDVGPVRGHRGEPLAGEWTGHVPYVRVDLREVDPDVATEHRAGEPGRARLIGVGHGGVGMLLDREWAGPAVLDRVAQPVQRADAGIAAPGEDEPLGAAHADELVV